MMIEEIESQIREGKNIEDILEKYDWKKFENIIAEIFKENGFRTKQNFLFKTKKRYEIDVIAVKGDKIFCIDCKWWNKGRYKRSGLKSAVTSQETRVRELTKFLKKNIIARNLLKVSSIYDLHSLIVTLHEEELLREGETFIIPAWKLNRFVIDLDSYI